MGNYAVGGCECTQTGEEVKVFDHIWDFEIFLLCREGEWIYLFVKERQKTTNKEWT